MNTDYAAAPACIMMATTCAICSRPLLDAKSLEVGMGPECRKKYGYATDAKLAGGEATKAANILIHQVALDRTAQTILAASTALHLLGFNQVATSIVAKAATVTVTDTGMALAVSSPYSEEATGRMRRVPGRRWDKADKTNRFPYTSKRELWACLKALYAGQLGRCIKADGSYSPFIIE